MKRSNLSKFFGAGFLTLSVAFAPLTLPASAQTNTAPDATTPNTTTDGTTATQGTATATDDRDFDWGWLGLLGLAGLAGLARKREEPVRYRDPDPATGTTYRE